MTPAEIEAEAERFFASRRRPMPCKACTFPARDLLDELIRRGASMSGLAQFMAEPPYNFQISTSGVEGHRNKGHHRAPAEQSAG